MDQAVRRRTITVTASVVVFAALFVLMTYLRPGVPNEVRILSGPEGSRSHELAQSYAEYIQEHRVDAEVVATAGSGDIARGLAKTDKPVVGFLQSGVEREFEEVPAGMQSLGSLYFEPCWVFVRKDLVVNDIRDLVGKRVYTGRPGSDTRAVVRSLGEAFDVSGQAVDAPFEQWSVEEAAESLVRGKIDAMFIAGSSDAASITKLFEDDRVRPLSVKYAEVYERRQPEVGQLTIPKGLFDLAHMIPRSDLRVAAPAINLVAHHDLDPALVDLFLDAATRIHKKDSLLAPPGTFPSDRFTSFPMNPDATRYYKQGPSGLRKYLPFWLATLVDRVSVYVLPLLAFFWTALKGVPMLRRLRSTRTYARLYRRLKKIEVATDKAERRDQYLRDLDSIDADSAKMHPSAVRMSTYFELRQTIHDLRSRIEES